jgi:hypothetical protein
MTRAADCDHDPSMAVPGPLAGRYAFVKRIRGTQRTIIWIARDQKTRAAVVASVLTGPRAAGLERAVGITHANVAAVLAILDQPSPSEIPDEEPVAEGARVAIAEYIEGRSLQQRLEAGPVALENAVEWTTDVADGLATLHSRGAVHGAVSPRAILVIRPAPAVVPTLTELVVPPSGAYCSPERVTGGGPSMQDDVWALAASLYTALARKPPFQGASRTELARAIVAGSPHALDHVDLDLWDIMARALSREPGDRFESAAAFRDALRDWTEMTGRHSTGDFAPVAALVAATEEPPNVGDLSLVAALQSPDSAEALAPLAARSFLDSGRPDPLAFSDPRELVPAAPNAVSEGPAGAAPTGAATSMVASRRGLAPNRTGRTIAIAAGVLASATIGVLFGTARHRTPQSDAASATANAVPAAPVANASGTNPPAAPSEPASAESPPGTSAAPSADALLDPSACAAATLPEKTLGDAPSVPFLCTQTDLWGITRKIDGYVLGHGEGLALVLWAHLGRFDLAAVAVLRQRCCPGAAPFTAAVPKGVCETLGDSIHAAASEPTAANLDRYAADIECYVSHGVRYPAEWWDRLTSKEARGYFEQFLGALRMPAK